MLVAGTEYRKVRAISFWTRAWANESAQFGADHGVRLTRLVLSCHMICPRCAPPYFRYIFKLQISSLQNVPLFVYPHFYIMIAHATCTYLQSDPEIIGNMNIV